jgi:hypothetical protein
MPLPNITRRQLLAVASGVPMPAGIANPATTGALVYPRSPAEAIAGVVPTNYQHVWGDLRRYGAVGGPYGSIPSIDDSVPFAMAVATGSVVIPQGYAFKVVATDTEFAGQITMIGGGDTSQIYCDGQLLTVTYGSNSLFSNFYLDSITTPLVFQRNVVTTVSTTATTIGPQTFTASLAGATSGTLTAAIRNGEYSFRFSDGEIRAVTVTGGTAARWSGALSSTAGAITTAGVLTITVAGGTGIAVGQQVFGKNIWNSTTVTNVSGTAVTLADPCSYSGTLAPVQFYSITFNTGPRALATLTNSKADGYRPPTINDTDVYSKLTSGQITQSLYGPIVRVTGNHVIVEKIYGRFVQIELDNCNHSQVRDCDFKAGLGSNGRGYGGIVFFNDGTSRNRGNSAMRNRIREAGNEGIFIMGCTEFICAHNIIFGCGDSGIEFYQDGPGTTPLDTYYMGGSGLTSQSNVCIGNSQGGINYTGNCVSIGGFNTAMCSSTGDYCAWQQYGAAGFYGDGWNVSGLACEYNGGPTINMIGNRSTFSNIISRENQFDNYGSFANLGFQGQGNLLINIRAWQDTNRSTEYTMAVYASGTLQAGNFLGQSTTLMNIDLRDAVTAAGGCLQLSGNVERFNVRTNGAPYDQGIEAKAQVFPAYGRMVAIDLSLGTSFLINATNGTGFTIASPTNAAIGQRFKVRILNSSGGELGTVTWGPAYRLAGALASPASGSNRSIEFEGNMAGTVFYEMNRNAADVPN